MLLVKQWHDNLAIEDSFSARIHALLLNLHKKEGAQSVTTYDVMQFKSREMKHMLRQRNSWQAQKAQFRGWSQAREITQQSVMEMP